MTRALDAAPPLDPAILAAFAGTATATISDNLGRLPGIVGLQPFHRGGRLLGRALTVRVRGGDNLAIHQALEIVRPGTWWWSTAAARPAAPSSAAS